MPTPVGTRSKRGPFGEPSHFIGLFCFCQKQKKKRLSTCRHTQCIPADTYCTLEFNLALQERRCGRFPQKQTPHWLLHSETALPCSSFIAAFFQTLQSEGRSHFKCCSLHHISVLAPQSILEISAAQCNVSPTAPINFQQVNHQSGDSLRVYSAPTAGVGQDGCERARRPTTSTQD